MKFQDRKQQRHVNEQMADLLLGIKNHANDDIKECIAITLRILQETEIEEKQELYCDRNICLRNEYNGIKCKDCEVTRSQRKDK